MGKNKFAKYFSPIWILLWAFLILAAISPIFWDSGFLLDYLQIFFSKICHQMHGRCFIIDGFTTLVCSRCLGIYTGFLLGWIFLVVFRPIALYLSKRSFGFAFFFVPAILDWLLRILGIIQANNYIGMITGFLLAFGIDILIFDLIYNDNKKL
ncbi:MAG: DUF2085 domain-containing protein [Candidatus Zixiibacteriota bacterium]